MNFEWTRTTKKDCEEFNKWNNPDELKFKEDKVLNNVKNLNKFLNADKAGGLGSVLVNYIGGDAYSLNNFFVKTARLNNEIVGVMAAYFNNESGSNVLECQIYAVKPELQGKGYGTAMLFDMVKNTEQIFGISNTKFVAYVNKNNKASIKAFEKNGFKKDDDWLKKSGIDLKPKTLEFSFDKENG